MNIDDIKTILIVGAGSMGQQIGLQCAIHGYQVVIYDIEEKTLNIAKQAIENFIKELIENKTFEIDSRSIMDKINFTTDAASAAKNADILSESVPEILELKIKVYEQFAALCPQRTLFTTNTSTLLPSTFAKATGRPEQFAALHFHQMVWKANIVDVMPHSRTSKETLLILERFAKSIGQIPLVLKKESPRYVFNALVGPLSRAAISLAANGVADIEDIDQAWMKVTNADFGPFGFLDLVGLKTVYDIICSSMKKSDDAQLPINADFIKQYVDREKLGIKTGEGFYQYPNPKYKRFCE